MGKERRAALRLGPGLLSGACNDDPGSVGTYSQVAAQFGFGLAWTLLFSFPLLVAVQEISARVARISGYGIAGNLRRHTPGWLAAALVALLSVANIFNLAADLGAMGAVLHLLAAGPTVLYVCLLGAVSVLFEILNRHARYVRLLQLLSLSLLSYVLGAFVVGVPWRQLGLAMLWPPLTAEPQYLQGLLAALGTTISPYLIFWQAQQELEAAQHAGHPPLLAEPAHAPRELARIRLDTLIGMGLSVIVALCILITSASALHAHGVLTIQDTTAAAEALRALGGRFTFMLFALGILGAGLVALPALSSSTAYAIGELLAWRVGRRHSRAQARAFYLAIAVATALAVVLNVGSLNPIRALYWSALVNGAIAVPLVAALMYLATSPAVMGSLRVTAGLRVLGWVAAATLGCSVAGSVVGWLS
ncbi:MAG TPA: divalent metal cation transporter [Steroidobacteraceae bacterium]|nr:divalent metal cation transporter [Steroidobacteraceae bacterium]